MYTDTTGVQCSTTSTQHLTNDGNIEMMNMYYTSNDIVNMATLAIQLLVD